MVCTKVTQWGMSATKALAAVHVPNFSLFVHLFPIDKSEYLLGTLAAS
jgi:hypothetical protein